ncbi:MAG: hypothetical protein QXU98_13500 [Candidatus Parvarchaeota archaeon]
MTSKKKKRNAGMQRKKENHLHIWQYKFKFAPHFYIYKCIDCDKEAVYYDVDE